MDISESRRSLEQLKKSGLNLIGRRGGSVSRKECTFYEVFPMKVSTMPPLPTWSLLVRTINHRNQLRYLLFYFTIDTFWPDLCLDWYLYRCPRKITRWHLLERQMISEFVVWLLHLLVPNSSLLYSICDSSCSNKSFILKVAEDYFIILSSPLKILECCWGIEAASRIELLR